MLQRSPAAAVGKCLGRITADMDAVGGRDQYRRICTPATSIDLLSHGRVPMVLNGAVCSPRQ